MAEPEALRMALGVAKILGRMHEHDIRHHGLHPGRVGLTEDGEVQLGALAFPQGVATRTPDASVRSLSCLAPEGFSPEGVLGRRSDIYAVGALLHELLLGAPIAEGNTIEGCTRSVLRGIQRSPAERRPGLSPGVSDLVMDCTRLNPQERIESMEEVVSRLAASLSLARSRSDSSTAVDPLIRGENERPQRTKSSRNISYMISAAIFIILQGVVYWLFYME
jgi:serine/threonine protein kinase